MVIQPQNLAITLRNHFVTCAAVCSLSAGSATLRPSCSPDFSEYFFFSRDGLPDTKMHLGDARCQGHFEEFRLAEVSSGLMTMTRQQFWEVLLLATSAAKRSHTKYRALAGTLRNADRTKTIQAPRENPGRNPGERTTSSFKECIGRWQS